MRNRVMLLSLAGLLAAGVALAGCDKSEQSKEPAKPGAQAPASPTSAIPAVTPPASPVQPSVATPEASPAPTPAPATGGQKTPWSDAKVGDTLVYKMTGGMQQTWQVTKVDDKNATVKITTQMNGMDVPPTEQTYPRTVATASPTVTPSPAPGAEVKDLGAETVKIDGQDIKCKVIQSSMKVGDKTITSKAWTSDQVPGGMVKSESDAMGAMGVMMELVSFKKGG